MPKVYCHTNLDIWKSEKFPDHLPDRPMVGDYVTSTLEWPNRRYLTLRVTAITWKLRKTPIYNENEGTRIGVHEEWIMDVELGLSHGSVTEFQRWYEDMRHPPTPEMLKARHLIDELKK